MLTSEILITLCIVLIAGIALLDYISQTYLEQKTRDIMGWSMISLTMGALCLRASGCLIELI